MFDFSPHSFQTTYHRALWYGLAFQAGAINAGGFLSTHSFVSHITGVGTSVGVEVASHNLLTALELLTIPLSFLFGAMVSSYLIDRRKALGKSPLYVPVMGLIWLLLSMV